MVHSAISFIIGIFVMYGMHCFMDCRCIFRKNDGVFSECRSIVVEYAAPFEDPNNKIWVITNQ